MCKHLVCTCLINPFIFISSYRSAGGPLTARSCSDSCFPDGWILMVPKCQSALGDFAQGDQLWDAKIHPFLMGRTWPGTVIYSCYAGCARFWCWRSCLIRCPSSGVSVAIAASWSDGCWWPWQQSAGWAKSVDMTIITMTDIHTLFFPLNAGMLSVATRPSPKEAEETW